MRNGRTPSWVFERNDAECALHLRVNGSCVLDAATGKPAAYSERGLTFVEIDALHRQWLLMETSR